MADSTKYPRFAESASGDILVTKQGLIMEQLGISAQVYRETKGVYYVKVHFALFGMYVSGITVRDSPKFPEKGLWVQMPYWGNFKSYIDFTKDSKLYPILREKVLEAVSNYEPELELESLDGDDLQKALEAFDGK